MKSIQWLALLLMASVLSEIAMGQTSDTSSLIKKLTYPSQAGNFSLGVRNNVNIFTNATKSLGGGVGGSARLQILNRLNTEWFADIISSNLYGKAHRTDMHIGWNVIFYLLDPKGFTRKFTPFLAAGNCFDYTKITINGPNGLTKAKGSSAVQMSVGCHYNLTPQFDISLSTLYDLHLGNDVDSELGPDGHVNIIEYRNAGLEGHIMIIASAHYKFIKLWKTKKSSSSFWA
jgi:hypothetical protein